MQGIHGYCGDKQSTTTKRVDAFRICIFSTVVPL